MLQLDRSNHPLLKFAMGCHRNHAILQSSNQFFSEDPSLPIQGVPMNNLAPMKICPGGGGGGGGGVGAR